ncbi:MAG: HAMP domain-containing protein [Elusimicrobia bacterium]|nr:HAMP domain-containing protein [Elusimicrobiota bacterium]
MAEQKFQRRTVLVKRTLQLKYVAIIFGSVVLAALMVGGDIYYTMTHLILQENPSLAGTISQVNNMILLKMALYLGIIFLVSLFVSHRFAGPIYRFEKSAQAVAGLDLTHRVSLRTGDDLLELQEEFNAMVASLQSQVQKDRALIARLGSRLDEAVKRLPDGDAGGAREELKALHAELAHLTTGFKV